MAAGRLTTAVTDNLSDVATRNKVPMFLSERSVPNEQEVIDSIQVLRRTIPRHECYDLRSIAMPTYPELVHAALALHSFCEQ